MKSPLMPSKNIRLKFWNDFAMLARDSRNFSTTVMEVESSQDHAALLKKLEATVRPYAVCILRPE